MEQHPVPQNVTTFQFRLIGDMTIKQFGYLAGGAILAYISYKLPLPFFFTWPLTIIFGVGGFGFAFVPVEERPMDIWVLSFIKSIYSPTQYVWSHQAEDAVKTPVPVTNQVAKPQARGMSEILRGAFAPPQPAPVSHVPTASAPNASVPASMPRSATVKQPVNPLAWFTSVFSARTTIKSAPSYPTPSIVGSRIDLTPPPQVAPAAKAQQEAVKEVQQKEAFLEQKLSSLKKDLENKSMTEARVLELQKQLTEVLTQKDKMEEELEKLRKQATPPTAATTRVVPAPVNQSSPAVPGTHVATPAPPKQPTVTIITPEGAVKAGLPRLTTFPNVVTGIIKDSENNFLPGVLVTVKDKDGMPLRALKTNRLGQFAASTPLANGVYFVEIEDPRTRFTFDRVQITLNGSIVPAIEVVAKSQKQVNREKLERELFGKPTP